MGREGEQNPLLGADEYREKRVSLVEQEVLFSLGPGWVVGHSQARYWGGNGELICEQCVTTPGSQAVSGCDWGVGDENTRSAPRYRC